MDRQTDRQTDSNRQTGRQTDRHTCLVKWITSRADGHFPSFRLAQTAYNNCRLQDRTPCRNVELVCYEID